MKASLSHLPGYKQDQILKIADVIKKVAAPEKIILFGSYAKGTWVEDEYIENGTRYSYISDYDFLVVTKNNEEKDYLLNDKIVNRSRHITNVAVNCIIHSIDYVNEGLSIGQYFFTDIISEGILLYDNNHLQFAQPKQLSAEEQRQITLNYFDQWFNRGSEFLIDAQNAAARDSNKNSAFYLHQATENFYNTVLLVFTGYKPKTHSLEKLRQYAKPYSKELAQIFPEHTGDKNESHLFDLLKRGYIDARYKNEYTITKQELTSLINKLTKMKEIVEGICLQKIKAMK